MKTIQKSATHLLLSAEIILVTMWYLFGTGGLQAIQFGTSQKNLIAQELAQLELDNSALEKDLFERTNNPYYQESIARKELQMAYPHETIYLLPRE